jgi:formylglycine-generating enzyme required for sulfatase activity
MKVRPAHFAGQYAVILSENAMASVYPLTQTSGLFLPFSLHTSRTGALIVCLVLLLSSITDGQVQTTEHAGLKRSENSAPTSPEWIAIPAGRFLMGSNTSTKEIVDTYSQHDRSEQEFRDETPQHLVEITRPFFMGATEVTVGEFRAFIEETNYVPDSQRDQQGGWGYDEKSDRCVGRDPTFHWNNTGYPQTDSHPVVNVSWQDCQAYCKWLSAKEKRLIRLPTEAEWEYANRAGTTSSYSMGDSAESILENARTLKPSAKINRLAIQNLKIKPLGDPPFPVPVGSYQPNAFGLYDMHGNVWEWTSDWYSESYYATSPRRDPTGPPQGEVKVRRGGAWNSFPIWARSSFRNWNTVESRCMNLGFRVVGEMSSWEAQEQNKQLPLRLLFVGDIMLDQGPGNAVANGFDPFRFCSEMLLDADLTIGNLECVLGWEGSQRNKPYVFRGAEGSAPLLAKYFQALSVANNHTLDFGPEGMCDSLRVLREHHIGAIGGGESIETARVPLILEAKGRRIALLAYNDFLKDENEATATQAGSAPLRHEWVLEDIEKAKAESKADIIILFVHWGHEMGSMPRPNQREQAKQWIDRGASAVIGSHPHVVQTIDSYRGAPIVYSLGNFVFDYFPVDPPKWTGSAVRLDIPANGPIEWQTLAVELDPQGLPHPVDPN